MEEARRRRELRMIRKRHNEMIEQLKKEGQEDD